MKKPVRIIIILVFIAALTVNAVMAPTMEVGLDQKMSMPDDSYVHKYFEVTTL